MCSGPDEDAPLGGNESTSDGWLALRPNVSSIAPIVPLLVAWHAMSGLFLARAPSQETKTPTPADGGMAVFERIVKSVGKLIEKGLIKHWGLSNENA